MKDITGPYRLGLKNERIFLMEIHEIIHSSIVEAMTRFNRSNNEDLNHYGFDKETEEFVRTCVEKGILKSMIAKVLEREMDKAFFDLLSLLDGIREPHEEIGEWNGLILIERPEGMYEDVHCLGEGFHEAYDLWKEYKDL
ncbi:MAG: hypothetical protein AAFQ20_00145 [Bacteroidota bacterium]